MIKEIDLGKVFLPEELVAAIEDHKDFMIEANKGTDNEKFLLNASFSMYFSDFMCKNYFKLM